MVVGDPGLTQDLAFQILIDVRLNEVLECKIGLAVLGLATGHAGMSAFGVKADSQKYGGSVRWSHQSQRS